MRDLWRKMPLINKASIDEECFEVEATEKDAAQNKASIEEEGSEEEKTNANLTAWDTVFFGGVQEKEYLMLLIVQNQQPAKPIVLQGNKQNKLKRTRQKNAVKRTATKKQLFGPSKRPKGQVGSFMGIAKVAMTLGYKRCV